MDDKVRHPLFSTRRWPVTLLLLTTVVTLGLLRVSPGDAGVALPAVGSPVGYPEGQAVTSRPQEPVNGTPANEDHQSPILPATPTPERAAAAGTSSRGGAIVVQADRETNELHREQNLALRGQRLAPSIRYLPPASAAVPILMYHHVADPPPGADAIRRDLSVGVTAFAAQMTYLADQGFHTLTLTDLYQHLTTGRPLPDRPIILTFDDGYRDNYEFAFPILRRRGQVGTFFLITSYVGQGEYLTWEQAREMATGGMVLQSHSLNHADLEKSSTAEVIRQVTESKAILEREVGTLVEYFCYPAGRYDGRTVAALQSAGYRAAVTTRYGTEHTPGRLFELVRVRIRGSDTLETFAAKVGGPPPPPPTPTPTAVPLPPVTSF